MVLIAHVSDTHLDGGPRAAERAARVLAFLAELGDAIDVVMVTGDIADHGLDSEYDEARALFAAHPRLITCPGNHDVRGAYRRSLLGDPAGGDGPVNAAHEIGGVVIAMCDSSIPGRDDGYLDDETIGWLDGVLDRVAPGAQALVAFHHPPVELHSPIIDAIRQHGSERLAAVLGRHPQVVAVLCGHAHTAAASTFAGRPLLVAPGVVSTVRLPWERRGHIDEQLPPALAFHVLDDDGRLTTHYRVVP